MPSCERQFGQVSGSSNKCSQSEPAAGMRVRFFPVDSGMSNLLYDGGTLRSKLSIPSFPSTLRHFSHDTLSFSKRKEGVPLKGIRVRMVRCLIAFKSFSIIANLLSFSGNLPATYLHAVLTPMPRIPGISSVVSPVIALTRSHV